MFPGNVTYICIISRQGADQRRWYIFLVKQVALYPIQSMTWLLSERRKESMYKRPSTSSFKAFPSPHQKLGWYRKLLKLFYDLHEDQMALTKPNICILCVRHYFNITSSSWSQISYCIHIFSFVLFNEPITFYKAVYYKYIVGNWSFQWTDSCITNAIRTLWLKNYKWIVCEFLVKHVALFAMANFQLWHFVKKILMSSRIVRYPEYFD